MHEDRVSLVISSLNFRFSISISPSRAGGSIELDVEIAESVITLLIKMISVFCDRTHRTDVEVIKIVTSLVLTYQMS